MARLESSSVLPVGWLIAAVVVAVVVTMWITFTLTRLDRLHARVDAAQAALEAQLVRRAAALQHVAEFPGSGIAQNLRGDLGRIAREALTTGQEDAHRRARENAVGRALIDVVAQLPTVDGDSELELRESAARVRIARRFYNDAVRDTRALREGRLPRLFRMAGRRQMPTFFDIDDTVPPAHTTPLMEEDQS